MKWPFSEHGSFVLLLLSSPNTSNPFHQNNPIKLCRKSNQTVGGWYLHLESWAGRRCRSFPWDLNAPYMQPHREEGNGNSFKYPFLEDIVVFKHSCTLALLAYFSACTLFRKRSPTFSVMLCWGWFLQTSACMHLSSTLENWCRSRGRELLWRQHGLQLCLHDTEQPRALALWSVGWELLIQSCSAYGAGAQIHVHCSRY